MTSNLTTDVATRIELGPRDRQEDRVRAAVNPDGSWVMAVADGLGGHPFGDEAAQAAVEALPGRIASTDEMLAAFDAANAAAWALRPEMRSAQEGVSSMIALTTLVVAAWKPQGGLLVSWIGDSFGFLVPLGAGRAGTAHRTTTPSGSSAGASACPAPARTVSICRRGMWTTWVTWFRALASTAVSKKEACWWCWPATD